MQKTRRLICWKVHSHPTFLRHQPDLLQNHSCFGFANALKRLKKYLFLAGKLIRPAVQKKAAAKLQTRILLTKKQRGGETFHAKRRMEPAEQQMTKCDDLLTAWEKWSQRHSNPHRASCRPNWREKFWFNHDRVQIKSAPTSGKRVKKAEAFAPPLAKVAETWTELSLTRWRGIPERTTQDHTRSFVADWPNYVSIYRRRAGRVEVSGHGAAWRIGTSDMFRNGVRSAGNLFLHRPRPLIYRPRPPTSCPFGQSTDQAGNRHRRIQQRVEQTSGQPGVHFKTRAFWFCFR